MILATEYKPKSVLEEYVVCFYFNKSDNFEYCGHACPTIHQELFFNLGDTFQLRRYDGQEICSRSWISGLQSKPTRVYASGRHITAGVIFKPWGLYAGFGLNSKDLCNAVTDSRLLYDFTHNQRNEAISPDQFFDLMEYTLIKLLKKSRLTQTMQRIINNLERENLTVLSEKLGCSKKSVIGSFNKLLGMSPQKYYTLKCVCEIIDFFQNNPTAKLTEIAYEYGFCDQAHFSRVFKEYTGFSPKEFLSNKEHKVNFIQF